MELRAAEAGVDVVTILPSSVHTPFYRWGPSKMGMRPHPVSVIYPPQVVADAIAGAAERPQRDIFVGMMGKLLSIGERVSPRMLDWYMLRCQHFFRQQLSTNADRGESNLFTSAGETDIEGPFTEEARKASVYTRVIAMRPNVRRAAAAAGLLLGAAALYRRVSRRSRAGRG